MTSGGSGRAEILTPRARVLLPVFLAALVALAFRQLFWLAPAEAVLRGATMGTTWSVTLAASGRTRADLRAARAAIEGQLEAVDARMSTWRADSELSRFNRHESLAPFPLSVETLSVLALAREVSERTGGAFDVTVAPLVAAWGFGAGARPPGQGPDARELAALRERVGFRLLELDPAAGTARKLDPRLRCDLSAIAKGFAVDQVTRALAASGWTDLLVEVGGEVRARGERPGGGAWRVGIERPDVEGRTVSARVALADRALATSGDYRSFYESGGRRVTHIVDPRSGRPIESRLASVSVVHPEAAVADAWATAIAVLGPDEGRARAEAAGLEIYLLLRTEAGGFEARATPGFPLLAEPGSPAPAGTPRDAPAAGE